MGYAYNHNLGAQMASGKIPCFPNKDIVLISGWLEPILGVLDGISNVGAVYNIQVNPEKGLLVALPRRRPEEVVRKL